MNQQPAKNIENSRYFTVTEIAERWQCSERTLRRLIANGTLPVHRFGNLVRVSEADLTLYERSNREA